MTSFYHVLSFCRSYLSDAQGCRTYSSTHVENSPRLSTVISTKCIYSRYFSLYLIHYSSRTCEIPTAYNLLSFREIMDLAQKFEGVACDKTMSFTELGPNRQYRILMTKRHNESRSHCGAPYPGISEHRCSGLPP